MSAIMVPHLTTSLTGPLHELERVILRQRPEIERWFRTQWLEHAVPFYTYGVVARLAMLAAAIEVEELATQSAALEVKAANA
jgi:hypothetical protein